MKTNSEIREKIRKKTATIYTASELKQMIREGERVTAESVDVVTCGTCGIMSGTTAILTVPVAPPGSFSRADKISLNGVPCFPGPCPNERLGLVDLVVYGTASADRRYGGGHLFRDIVEGKDILVTAEADGNIYEKTVTRDDLDFARMITTRSAFKNYSAFVNPGETPVSTIFSVTGLKGGCSEVSASGCGEINPLQNWQQPFTIRPGTRVLVNGAEGLVIGNGTRSSREKPNLSVSAEIPDMHGEYMGGFVTSDGPECIMSLSLPIPVRDDRILSYLSVLDEEITLPVNDISDRKTISEASYGELWQGTDHTISYNPDACIACDECYAAKSCPTGAFEPAGGVIDRRYCFNCGTCIQSCPAGAFKGNLGSLSVRGRDVPVTLRQSDRARAEEICCDLKEQILNREFLI